METKQPQEDKKEISSVVKKRDFLILPVEFKSSALKTDIKYFKFTITRTPSKQRGFHEDTTNIVIW